ncbi:MAG TPA: hypothetical protein DCQ98_08680 [Planctomycetaceae bacterium]|nr:hypothetical protein [Planctomycetaceae bacterium]
MATIASRGERLWFTTAGWLLVCGLAGCGNLRLPAIDPSGERFLLPAPAYTTLAEAEADRSSGVFPQPAFTQPPVPPPCDGLLGNPTGAGLAGRLRPAKLGELQVVPTQVVAPVSSEVIIVGGICGTNGRYVPGKTLEWVLSQESVGNFVQAGRGPYGTLQQLIHPTNGKRSANFIKTTAARNAQVIDRGTPSTLDDVPVSAGQGWVTITSPSEGTSRVTVWSPDAEGWDKRRKTTTIHWLDAAWSLPPCAVALSGSLHPLTVSVRRESDGEPVPGWRVEYEVLPGSVPAGLVTGTGQLATKEAVLTDENGNATLMIRQPNDLLGPGTSQVKIDLIRPENLAGTRERLRVASTVSTITWSAPALTIRAEGPSSSGRGGEFAYVVDVTNPGDLPAENVQLAIGRPDAIEILSSQPSPTQFGANWIWNLARLEPHSTTRVEVVVRAVGRGKIKTCFTVAASNVPSQAEACVETDIAVTCLNFAFLNEPRDVRVGETADYRFRITNDCDQPLTGIQVEADFDAGLSFGNQPTPIGLPPFDLLPGQSEEVALPLVVLAPGNQCLRVAVSADGGHTVRAQSCLDAREVPRAMLDVEIRGPQQLTRGIVAPYEVRVINPGNVPVTGARMVARFSNELKVVGSNPAGRFEPEAFVIDLAPLDPQTSTIISLDLEGTTPETAVFEVVAEGIGAIDRDPVASPLRPFSIEIMPARGDIVDEFPGRIVPPGEPIAPAVPNPGPTTPPAGPGAGNLGNPPTTAGNGRLELALTELVDPVDRGGETFVIVTLRNVGQGADSEIEVTLGLPAGLQFVQADQGTLNFAQDPRFPDLLRATRREMRPGDVLTARIQLRAIAAGDQVIQAAAASTGSVDPIAASTAITVNP